MEDYRPNPRCSCFRCRCRGYMGPAVLVTLGVLFLLDTLAVRGASFCSTWPLLLVVIGAVKVLQYNGPTEGHVNPGPPPPASAPGSPAVTSGGIPPGQQGQVNNA